MLPLPHFASRANETRRLPLFFFFFLKPFGAKAEKRKYLIHVPPFRRPAPTPSQVTHPQCHRPPPTAAHRCTLAHSKPHRGSENPGQGSHPTASALRQCIAPETLLGFMTRFAIQTVCLLYSGLDNEDERQSAPLLKVCCREARQRKRAGIREREKNWNPAPGLSPISNIKKLKTRSQRATHPCGCGCLEL